MHHSLTRLLPLAMAVFLSILMVTSLAHADSLYVVGGGGGGGGGGAEGLGGNGNSAGGPIGRPGGTGNSVSGGGGGGGAGGYVGSNIPVIDNLRPDETYGPGTAGVYGGGGGTPGTSQLDPFGLAGAEDIPPGAGYNASSTTGGAGGEGASVSLSTFGGSFDSIFVNGGNGGDGGWDGSGSAGGGGDGGSASLTLTSDTIVTGNVNVVNGFGGAPNDGGGGTGGDVALTVNGALSADTVFVSLKHIPGAAGSGGVILSLTVRGASYQFWIGPRPVGNPSGHRWSDWNLFPC